MNIAIVEDTAVGTEIIRNMLFEYARANAVSFDVDTFASAEEFLRDYHAFQYTVIFMDIYMEGMDGVQAAEKVREMDTGTLIVFLTASSSHMPQAFNVHAYNYIQKPIEPEQLFHLMDEIRSLRTKNAGSPQMDFVCGKKEHSLKFSDIISITVDANYLEIHSTGGEVYRPRMTFSAACDRLAKDSRFLMILRGILVNMDHIEGFHDGVCTLTDGRSLPVNVKNSRKIEHIWVNYRFVQQRNSKIP